MHTLLIAGDDEQLETYLRPLAEGRDPLLLRDDRAGRGELGPDEPRDDRGPRRRRVGAQRAQVVHHRRRGAAFAIVVAKTGTDEAAGHRNYSLILVPTDTPGWRIVRHPEWMGSHSPGGHPEIELEDVRVPLGNLLGGEGEGFVIAQQRLAGGRLAHAMRWIGAAQRALDLSAAAAADAQGVRQGARAPPGPAVHARRLRDGPLREPADGAAHRLEGRARPAAPPGGRDDQDVRVGGVRPDRRPRGADARRRRHRDGPADRADLPGRARRADLRRRQRGAPHGRSRATCSSSRCRASRSRGGAAGSS